VCVIYFVEQNVHASSTFTCKLKNYLVKKPLENFEGTIVFQVLMSSLHNRFMYTQTVIIAYRKLFQYETVWVDCNNDSTSPSLTLFKQILLMCALLEN